MIKEQIVAGYDKTPLGNYKFKKPLKWIDGTFDAWDNRRGSYTWAGGFPPMGALIVPVLGSGYEVFIIDKDRVSQQTLDKIVNQGASKLYLTFYKKFPYKSFKADDLALVKKSAEKFLAYYSETILITKHD